MPRLRFRWIPAFVLALQAILLAPAGVLAEMRADRCCEDHCPEHRSAPEKAECCGVDLRATAEAAVSRVVLEGPPASVAAFAAPILIERARVAAPRFLLESPGKGAGPPIFLALRSLRI